MKTAHRPGTRPTRSGRPQPISGPVPGLAARRVAADILDGVLRRRRPLDEMLEATLSLAGLEERDRALARALTAAVLRLCWRSEFFYRLSLLQPRPPRNKPSVCGRKPSSGQQIMRV